ncbi:MAG: hypothetical protein WD772_11780, partial [Pseudohongiellaceae bacterium]
NFWNSDSIIAGNVSTPTTIAASAAFGAQLNQAYLNAEVRALNLAEAPTSTSVIYTDPLCTSGLTDANGNPFYVAGSHPKQKGDTRQSQRCLCGG